MCIFVMHTSYADSMCVQSNVLASLVRACMKIDLAFWHMKCAYDRWGSSSAYRQIQHPLAMAGMEEGGTGIEGVEATAEGIATMNVVMMTVDMGEAVAMMTEVIVVCTPLLLS